MLANGRSAFRATNGYIGMGPRAMRPGDIVVALIHGAVPFILRPRDDRYLLVGECYVHGIMFGELFDGKNYEDIRKDLQWFNIHCRCPTFGLTSYGNPTRTTARTFSICNYPGVLSVLFRKHFWKYRNPHLSLRTVNFIPSRTGEGSATRDPRYTYPRTFNCRREQMELEWVGAGSRHIHLRKRTERLEAEFRLPHLHPARSWSLVRFLGSRYTQELCIFQHHMILVMPGLREPRELAM